MPTTRTVCKGPSLRWGDAVGMGKADPVRLLNWRKSPDSGGSTYREQHLVPAQPPFVAAESLASPG